MPVAGEWDFTGRELKFVYFAHQLLPLVALRWCSPPFSFNASPSRYFASASSYTAMVPIA